MKKLALPLFALTAFTACADVESTDAPEEPVAAAAEAATGADKGGVAPPVITGDSRPRGPRAQIPTDPGGEHGNPHGGTPSAGPDGGASRSFVGGDGVCTRNVRNQTLFGRVLAAPTVHRIFLGDFWSQPANVTEAASYDNTWTAMSAKPAFWDRLSEYGVGIGSAGPRWNITGSISGSQTEASIQSRLQTALNNASYTPTANDVFVIFLPAGATAADDFNGHTWDGHHNHFTMWRGIFSYDVVYAVIEYVGDADYRNPVVSHEIIEAATDPDLNAFYGSDTNEIGDYCRGTYHRIAGTNVEAIYSQRACACVTERDLDALDFDGEGHPNPTVFRPSQAVWYSNGGSPNWAFGDATMTPLPGDYDGDGRSEYALFKAGDWYVLDTAAGVYTPSSYGTTGDIPVPADYDGDGRTDRAVWRPSNGTWYVWLSGTNTYTSQQWGVNGDIPVPGDYDGDGKADFAVRRPSAATWYVIPSTNPSGPFGVAWGVASDVPVAADINADGQVDWVLWRPSEGRFYVNYKDSPNAYWTAWGQAGDVPVVRDYDGDFKADLAVWRPSNGTWYIAGSMNGNSSLQWGAYGDIPLQRNTRP